MSHNLKYGKTYYIRMCNESELTVTGGTNILFTNSAIKFPAVNLRTDGTDTANTGYVQATVNSWAMTPTETVNVLTSMITCAMLSTVLRLLERTAS